LNKNQPVIAFGLVLFFSLFTGVFISTAQAATITTSFSDISITPNSSGLGQQITIVTTLSPEPPSGYSYHGIQFNVIDSNGNYRCIGTSNAQPGSGTVYFYWIPDILGRYQVLIYYRGETLAGNVYAGCQRNGSYFFVDPSLPSVTPTPIPTTTPPTETTSPSNPGTQTALSVNCQSSTTYTNFKVNIQGTLTANNVGLSDLPVQLSYSVNGGNSWEALTYLSTDDAGAFQAVWSPTVTGNYFIKASYYGNSELAPASTTVHIAVIPFQDTSVFSVASNSTVTALAFNSTSQTLSFKVSGEDGTTGYANIYISKSLLSDPSHMNVYFDQELLQPTTQSVGDSWLVSFNYHHSVHSVSLALNSDSSGSQPQLQNLPYIVAGVAAAVVLVIVTIAIVLLKNRAKRTPI
jgi:hypothetical protein